MPRGEYSLPRVWGKGGNFVSALKECETTVEWQENGRKLKEAVPAVTHHHDPPRLPRRRLCLGHGGSGGCLLPLSVLVSALIIGFIAGMIAVMPPEPPSGLVHVVTDVLSRLAPSLPSRPPTARRVFPSSRRQLRWVPCLCLSLNAHHLSLNAHHKTTKQITHMQSEQQAPHD